jgi:outer membrane protein OmpA-like peptidoglycan-associated protein
MGVTMPLLDSLTNAVTPKLTARIAEKLGESPDAVARSLKGAFDAILAALTSKAGTAGVPEQLLALIQSPANDTSILSDPTNIPQAMKDLAAKFLTTLFGGSAQQTAAAAAIAQAAHLKPASAATIFGTAAPMVLGLLGKQNAIGGGLTGASLAALFAPAAATHSDHAAHAEPDVKGGGAWVLPALIALMLVGGLFWWLFKSPEKEMTAAVKPPAAEVMEAPKNMWAALGEFFKRKLPDGVELSIPKLGVENKLIDFIEDSSKAVDKETWFDFDRLLFDTGKATLQPASEAQLKDVAAILNAYPKVHFRIGGYTDNAGDKVANQKLSEARAASVMAELVRLGTDATRLDSKGYGEEHPVASNTTEEGRALNRRVSVRVTQK